MRDRYYTDEDEREGRYQEPREERPRNYSLLCATYLRKLNRKASWLIVLMIISVILGAAALFGSYIGSVIAELITGGI